MGKINVNEHTRLNTCCSVKRSQSDHFFMIYLLLSSNSLLLFFNYFNNKPCKLYIKMVPSHNLFYFCVTYLIKPLIELANCRKIFRGIQDNHLICNCV